MNDENRIEDSALAQSGDYRLWVERIRAGIPVAQAVRIMEDWGVRIGTYAAILGTSERKWSRLRTMTKQARLSAAESDRLLRVVKVLQQANEVFDSREDAKKWLTTANSALSGSTPMSLLDTGAGVEEVATILGRIQYGIYS